jgi:WD40 repeat protein
MPAIFISHSSRDQAVADDIKSALAKLGFDRVFLDFDKDSGFGAGEAWEKRLYEEVSRSHAIILVLTPNWLASTWCRVELAQARALGKVIVPVICATLGESYVLPEIHSVDLVDWNAGGLERIEQRLHAITAELARGFTLDPLRPPFPGIHAFEAEDAAIYFGRDEETRAVIERLDARRTQGGARLLVIIGASGAGKSSLLKAGILPQLGRRRSQWIVLPVMRPEKAPLEALAKIVSERRGEPQDWRSWHERLSGPEAVQEFAELLRDLRVGPARGATVLLPIDQLEELFTIAEAEARTDFLHLLSLLLDPARDLPIMAVATGRADVLQGLLEASELAPLTEMLPLVPIPLDRVSRLIEGPATVVSLIVERGLAERIMRDVESPEALPLLAQTLRLLHGRCTPDNRLTLAAYDALGDPRSGLNSVQNSVRLAADEATRRLNPSPMELAALRNAFVPYLVRLRLDDGRRVRQPAPLASLPREAERLIRALTEARLLTVRVEEGEAVVEVAHEALFAAWPMLASWLDAEQAFLADIERIKSAHEAWFEAPPGRKPQALMQGLLLSNARDSLVKHPERFIGRDMEELRAFIAASAAEEDAARARSQRLRRRVFQAALAAAVIFFAASVVTTWQYYRAEGARRGAAEQEDIAKAQRDQAERSLATAKLSESRFLTGIAETEMRNGNPVLAGLLALAALPVDMRTPDRPLWPLAVWTLARARNMDRSRAVLEGHIDAVSTAAYSPDGSRIVTASWDHTARIWDARTGVLLGVIAGHTDRVRSAAWSPDGTRIVTASLDKTARIWDARTAAQLATLTQTAAVWSAAWSPDGSRIVTGSRDKTARIWDAKTGAPLAVLQGHTGEVGGAAWSADGSRILTASEDKTARIWDAKTGAPLAVLQGPPSLVQSAAWSPDGSRIVTTSFGNTARIWDAKTSAPLGVLEGHTGWVYIAAYSPDGQRIVTASEDKTARIWDAKTGAQLAVLEGHTNVVWDAAWSPDGMRIVTSSWDNTARIWDAKAGAPFGMIEGHTDVVYGAAWSPAGARIVTASGDNTARIWDANTGAQVAVLEGHTATVRSAAWSPDGQQIVTASWDNTGRIWDAKTGAPLAVLEGHTAWLYSAAWSPDESRIVTASDDKTARIWDAKTGAQLAVLEGHTATVRSAAWSPDGLRIVTASSDNTAWIWEAKTGVQLEMLKGHIGAINSAAWSPDGSRIVTASDDKTARIWDAKTGAPLAVLDVGAAVITAAWSPDGLRIVTTSLDNIARMWDARTGVILAVIEGHTDAINSAAWSPDGSRIVTASSDNTARIWDAWPLLTSDTVTYAAVSALRGLTTDERARLFSEMPKRAEPTQTVSAVTAQDVTGMSVVQLRAAASASNPYAHRRLAEMYERGETVEASLERALFYHAVEARLFEAEGNEVEAQIAYARRGSDARALPPEVAVRIAYEAMDWRPLSAR